MALVLHPLALALGAVCATPDAHANTTVVTNCADDGIGSLRAAMIDTHSGDTVDLTHLTCSSISLQTGEIAINQDDLTIQGPGRQFFIEGKYKGRVLHHFGTGTLTLRDVTARDGAVYHYVDQQNTIYAATGGCIASNGAVQLVGADVSNCKAIDAHTSGQGYSPAAAGGAIFASGEVTLTDSTVENGRASARIGSTLSGDTFGGGIWSGTALVLQYSTVRNNRAEGGQTSRGGGVYVRGGSLMLASTLSGNSTTGRGGAAYVNSTYAITIGNSTISGNSADTVGGLFMNASLNLVNSTVSFNRASHAGALGVGVWVTSYNGTTTANLQSSIIAANTYAEHTANDFEAFRPVTVTGANNLVGASSTGLPSDTIVGACPLLGPLRDNGGPTQTHALRGHSPAIDAGNDVSGISNDQRGVGHARRIGVPGEPAPRADIGAYEVDRADEIFDAAFEGC